MNEEVKKLNVRIFADGAVIDSIRELNNKPYIRGFTTNPTLMKQAGVRDYKDFALEVLEVIQGKPISFEVFSDDPKEMYRQAHEISSWGKNISIKIPVTNSEGVCTRNVVKNLMIDGISCNVTAIMTVDQVIEFADVLASDARGFFSIFAGRIADTGRDPIRVIQEALNILVSFPEIQVIWASPRELLNVIQANDINCHVITATKDILSKLEILGKDLKAYSLDTVKMFKTDAELCGFQI